MGTDIHIVVEQRTSDGWVAVNTLTCDYASPHLSDGSKPISLGSYSPIALTRNYRRFAALAGVRGEGPQARGFPSDASDTTRLLWGRDSGHYHRVSYLALRDAIEIFHKSEVEAVREHICDPEWVYFNIDETEVEIHRIVFWFDS